jgi:hypothetical protein
MASQAALGGEANASAASALRTTQDMLNKAVEDETAARKAKGEAEQKRDATKEKIKALGQESEDTEEEKAQRKQLATELEEQEKDVKTKSDALARAEQTRKAIETNRDAAFAESRAAARGTASLSSPATAGAKLNNDSTAHIANTVERIVSTVIGKNHLVDNCVNFLIKDQGGRGRNEAEILADARAKDRMSIICADVMKADVEMRKKSNLAQANAYEVYYKGPLPKPKPDQLAPSPDKLVPPPSGVY